MNDAEPDGSTTGDDDERPPPRPPGRRRDPAAMRETLDAARRRLGVSGPNDVAPESAAHQRALLREAVANQSLPLTDESGRHPTAASDDRRADDADPED